MGMTTRGAWIREATETDALECGAAHHAIAFEPRVDRETPRVGGGRHGAFVCVPCARESRGAWTGRTRQRQWTGRAPARVSFEFPSSVREPETIVVIFYRTRAHRILLLRAFSSSPRLTSRYKASRSLASCGPRASRVARARRASPVRAMLAARDRRSRGVAGFARSPPGLFGDFPVSKSPRGVLAGERVGSSAEVQKVGVAS